MSEKKPRFVIQKHKATSMHYDFRLEIGKVLKSWAIPKGPSCDPKTKRLAIETDDHSLSYLKFEGVIPQGEYGAGTVMVWDIGIYKNLKKRSMKESLKKGEIEIWLFGKKIKGGYALIRTKLGNGKNWLLIKMKDSEADARKNPVTTKTKSVLTERSLAEITKEEKQ